MKYGNISSAMDIESFNNSNKICSTFFYYGCNFRCGFCHNHKMMQTGEVISEENLYKALRKAKRNWVSTIVVTGGEPTLDLHLKDFLSLLKSWHFQVKLDTNGSNPEILEQLLKEKLVDYVAMDIKGTLEQYPVISQWSDTEKISRSIAIVRSIQDYEFRTTVIPKYHKADEIKHIGMMLNGSKLYVLQQFQPNLNAGCLDQELQKERTYTEAELTELSELVKHNFREVRVKCR